MKVKGLFIFLPIIIIIFSGAYMYLYIEKDRLEKQIIRLEVEIDSMQTGYSHIISGLESRLDGLESIAADINRKQTEEPAWYKKYLEVIDTNLTDMEKKLSVKEQKEEEDDESFSPHIETGKSIKKDSLRLDDVKLNNYYKEGIAAYNKGDYAKATSEFGKLIGLDPPVWEGCLYYIQSAYVENPGKAASDAHIDAMLTALPEYLNEKGKVSKMKGLLALEQGKYETGLSHIKQSLSLNPSDAWLRNHTGMAAYAFKDYETCITYLAKRSSLPTECIYTLGRAYEMICDTTAALEQYDSCVTSDPVYYQAYNRIGILKKQEGFYKDAAEAFLKYHSFRKEAENMYLLGECYLSLDDEDRAISLFREILSRFPESPRAEEILNKQEQVW
jgi:tetratricopeptide (TPR) repeat protein